MLKMKLSNKFMTELLYQATENENIILGSGSERTAIAYNSFFTLKVPNWWEVTDRNYFRKQKEEIMKDKENKNTFFEMKDTAFLVYHEKQTQVELDIFKLVPIDIVNKYGARIFMWGMWNGHLVTLCERLTPIDSDSCDYDCEQVLHDVEELLSKMEKDMQDYPIRIADIHPGNFGYTNTGKIKFCDLGYWRRSYGKFFSINWNDIESWKDNYYCSSGN